MKEFHQLIKKWRTESKMTQKELADKLFLSHQAVSLLENGKRTLSFDILKEIAVVFNKDIEIEIKEQPFFRKINRDILNCNIKPLLLDHPTLIDICEADIEAVARTNNYNGFMLDVEVSDSDIFDLTLELFMQLLNKHDLKESKGVIAYLLGGEDFEYDDLEFFSNQIHKRVSSEANLIVTCGVELDKRSYFKATFIVFG